MKTLKFKLSGAKLRICDMRPGISQDGLDVDLPAGEYQCRIAPVASTELSTISYLLDGKKPDTEKFQGEVSLDMARVGVLDLEPLLAQHSGNWEDLAEWSDVAADEREESWGGTLLEADIHAAFYSVGSDCVLDVFTLQSAKETVGMLLRPRVPEEVVSTPKRWTWVELKLHGIGDVWEYCDDWAYDPDEESILDDIEFELSYFTEQTIDHEKPLAAYCTKIGGVDRVRCFIEDQGHPRKSITKKIFVPKIAEPVTSARLSMAVLELFKQARKLPH